MFGSNTQYYYLVVSYIPNIYYYIYLNMRVWLYHTAFYGPQGRLYDCFLRGLMLYYILVSHTRLCIVKETASFRGEGGW